MIRQLQLDHAAGGLRFVPTSSWSEYAVSQIKSHYTGSAGAPPGKKQAWDIIEDGRDVGTIGIGEPPYKLAPRRRVGLLDARPLPHTVCCYIFRVNGHKSRASYILREWHEEAADQWKRRYGWAPVHWETMIGPDGEGGRQHHGGALGACFRRCGYRSLGWTTGRSARRPPGHSHRAPRVWKDGTPKLVLYRGPLARVPK